MKNLLALAALLGAAIASPLPQGVTEEIPPPGGIPDGAVTTEAETFEMQIINVTSTATKVKRATSGILTMTLTDSVLMDQAGRTGYVAANYQFQFDAPPQTGAIYTSGFSIASNNSICLGPNCIWYACLSGTFYNLYSTNQGNQCFEVYFEAINFGVSSSSRAKRQVSEIADGQPQAPTGAPVSQIGDGQPQAPTGAPVSQIGDGQPQAPTGAPVSQIGDGQPQAPTGAPAPAATGAPVSQIGDGQPQAPTGAPVSQIGDGQPQAPTGAPVSQIGDGQPQAPTGAPVSQIGDGQPQAPTGAPVSQIGDGQPQAPTPTGAAVTQIGDGQPQAPAAATYTGAASYNSPAGLMFAGILGFAAFL